MSCGLGRVIGSNEEWGSWEKSVEKFGSDLCFEQVNPTYYPPHKYYLEMYEDRQFQ
jgi:hypothetical protein